MNEYYRELYLDWLRQPVQGPNGPRPRARKIQVWENFQPKLKHGTERDLNEAVSIGLRDGPQVWLWSDQHFGHKNILSFSDRPYPNLNLMHECLIANHNDRVAHGDISIWVGDVAFLNDNVANEILSQCNGYKILIIGNHDIQGNKSKKLDFDETHLFKHINVAPERGEHGSIDFVLTHYPVHTITGKRHFNLHGHEHVRHQYTNTPHHINVNCELHNYRPINMNQIIQWARLRIL